MMLRAKERPWKNRNLCFLTKYCRAYIGPKHREREEARTDLHSNTSTGEQNGGLKITAYRVVHSSLPFWAIKAPHKNICNETWWTQEYPHTHADRPSRPRTLPHTLKLSGPRVYISNKIKNMPLPLQTIGNRNPAGLVGGACGLSSQREVQLGFQLKGALLGQAHQQRVQPCLMELQGSNYGDKVD